MTPQWSTSAIETGVNIDASLVGDDRLNYTMVNNLFSYSRKLVVSVEKQNKVKMAQKYRSGFNIIVHSSR